MQSKAKESTGSLVFLIKGPSSTRTLRVLAGVGRVGKCSDFGTAGPMETLSKLQQARRVVQDFTLNTLAGIEGAFARLVYVASLRDQDRKSTRLNSSHGYISYA